MKHVVAVFEILPAEGGGTRVQPLHEGFVKASNLDDANKAARKYVADSHKEYTIRSVAHSTDGKILAYVVHTGPQKRKRFIKESDLRRTRS